MSSVSDNYRLLLSRLDAFIRKYYLNQLIRGLLYCCALLPAAYLLIALAEYLFYLPSAVRTILFYGFLLGAGTAVGIWIFRPLTQYLRLGPVLSHEQAARLIGNHFTEVQDRLLNVLQLRQQADTVADAALIEASINQKIAALRPIPFTAAINLKKNRRYLRYALPPVLVILALLLASPAILTESAYRLIHYNNVFERPAPFRFLVTPQPLQTVQFEDKTITVRVEGQALPQQVTLSYNGMTYPMQKLSPDAYAYTFVKPEKNISFSLEGSGFRSREYELRVLARPIILRFSTLLNYPAYTGRKPETLQNIGDLTVPEGTEAVWQFQAQNVTQLHFLFGDSLQAAGMQNNSFTFSRRLRSATPYRIYVSGSELPRVDSLSFAIHVIPDRYPTIDVVQLTDSTQSNYLYFAGNVADDYGLRRLLFRYQVVSEQQNSYETGYESVTIPFSGNRTAPFSFFWDLAPLNLQPGQQVFYYFEVWDNDGVNGSKSSRSPLMRLQKPSAEQLLEQASRQSENLKEEFKDLIEQTRQLHQDLEKARNTLLGSKTLSWEEKKKLESLLQRQQSLMQRMQQLRNQFDQTLQRQSEFRQFNQELQEKNEQLQKLMDELLTDEMQELLRRLNELLNQLNKDLTLDQLENQKRSSQQLEKQLDRLLSLYKRLEFEKKMTDIKDQLQELARRQEELAKSSQQTDLKKSEEQRQQLEEQQQQLAREFESVEQQLNELEKLNQQLDHPTQLPDTEPEQQQTRQQMEQAGQHLKNQDGKKAGQHQRNAAQNMQRMSEKLDQALSSMQMQQTEMDLQATRQILENLIKASFDQEELLNRTKQANVNTPQYLQTMQAQKALEDDLQMIKDSITELSKRVFQIQRFVQEQVSNIDKHMAQALDQLQQRRPAVAAASQQHIMMALNNLALMFDEVLQQLQQQMAAQMTGSQMCQRPGSQQQGRQSLSDRQQQLNDRIEQLGQKMKEGSSQGKRQGFSQEIAELAQEQARIREALRQLNEELNKDGHKTLGDLEKLQREMEKTETELLNRQLSGETLKRQKDIFTRLLEAENAERERETDEQRQARTASPTPPTIPPELADYLKRKQVELELFKTVPPELKPFYRQLVEQYYKSLQNN
ncbi:MAG: DUF4175 family protein [Chitinophagales bacterium]|nr:DUF4175 family protein [Chitinophagales bacterium]MDW8394117.1 DUF4175 family protein [Chitinophagales bacterium]